MIEILFYSPSPRPSPVKGEGDFGLFVQALFKSKNEIKATGKEDLKSNKIFITKAPH